MNAFRRLAIAGLAVLTMATGVSAEARGRYGYLNGAAQEIKDTFNGRQQDAPKVPMIEVGFSPEGTAETLVLKFIGSAKEHLFVMGYAWTAQNINSALIAARGRGVDVQIVLDQKETSNEHSQRLIAALVNAGIPVHIDGRYPVFHDKVMISDMRHVETGSFNYTAAAERHNSENALLLWNNPSLAEVYYRHFKTRFDESPAAR